LLVGLEFFLDQGKEVHWIGWIERKLSAIAEASALEIAVVLVALLGIAHGLPDEEALRFVVAGLLGIIAHIVVKATGEWLESHAAKRAMTGAAVSSGLGGFLYLNVLDTSFSLDGVIGAFALSNNMVVIAIGLSIGALFVRSMTLMMVENATLAEYRYLEHGAFWAIVSLGVIMLGSARWEVPDVVTGLIGAVMIALALWWSVRHRRREALEGVPR
jgi:hypothetical protein